MSRTVARKASAALKVTMPEIEMYMPSASARCATSAPELKQWIRPGKAPLAYSSSRMSPVSPSASRVWTISGRPVWRAAAIWARKLSACSARGLCS